MSSHLVSLFVLDHEYKAHIAATPAFAGLNFPPVSSLHHDHSSTRMTAIKGRISRQSKPRVAETLI